MENKTFAYVRVSSKEQNLSRQIDSMLQYVKDPRDIYCDKQSGKNFERPGYQALFYNLRSGDELYIHTLSRLGRNKTETKNQLIELQKKGVLVRVLDIPTTLMDFSAFGSLQRSIMEMVNNILIEVLSTIAEVERDNIRTAQKEGIQSAKKRGIHFGRSLTPYPDSWSADYKAWKNDQCSAISLIRKYNFSASTFYRLVRRWEKSQKIH
jgi:DNA invertase Pin-like site-specific DNA recombinase